MYCFGILATAFGLLVCLLSCTTTRGDDPSSYGNKLYTSHILSSNKCRQLLGTPLKKHDWSFNSSNAAKAAEFKSLFKNQGLIVQTITSYDLREIDAKDILVVIHKASQIPDERLIVEDSALDVEGADVGVNLKWHMRHIDSFIGRQATLHSLLAYRHNQVIFVFKHSVHGSIVQPRGPIINGSRLNAYFQPINSDLTLAESGQDPLAPNPRAEALKDLVQNNFALCSLPVTNWDGSWQNE